jgi:ribonuclease G
VREQAPAPTPVAAEEPSNSEPRVVFDMEQDDFFVLPGESLAKYKGGPEDESEEAPGAEAAEPSAPTVEPVAEPDLVHQAVIAARVEADEVAAEVVAAAEPEVEEAPVAAVPAAEPEPVVVTEVAIELPVQVVSFETGFTSIDTEEAPADFEAVEAAEAGVESEAQAEESMELEGEVEGELEGDAEGGEPQLEGEAGAETAVEDEGPEPARIPTSLTATLREQGSRYPHRVSRRTRRKGRGERGPDRGGERGPLPEGQRGPQGELRPQEGRPEQRTGPRPEGRSEGRPEGRPEARPEARSDRPPLPSISDLLKEGQEIIVQIAKEPLGQKGARITSHIALPGRFLVYMPTVDHIGVSRKIPSDDERLRLKRILQTNRTGIPGGYIVRTAGDGRTEEELRADMMFLYNLWLDMRQKAERRAAPLLIHHDLNVVERILRDQLTSSYKSVWVDNEEVYESVLRFVQRFQPALVNRVKMYTRTTPIFDEFGITAELEKALRPKVWLKSGGYIVINQTEALVAIDINTGKYVGKSNRLEDTIVKTNTDAIKEIVRQIRLRDLGGIIVVDFIDMDERKNRQKVMQALEEAMRADRAPYKILQFNDFGLVAITRKRVKQSLERTLCTPCPYCEGAGYVKSPQTVVGEILQEAHKIARAVDGNVMLRVAPEVAKLLKSNQNTFLQEVEEILGRPVIVKSDPLLHQEKFDLA